MSPKVWKQCPARHPLYRKVRCEEERGHDGEHFHSFYMRRWSSAEKGEAR